MAALTLTEGWNAIPAGNARKLQVLAGSVTLRVTAADGSQSLSIIAAGVTILLVDWAEFEMQPRGAASDVSVDLSTEMPSRPTAAGNARDMRDVVLADTGELIPRPDALYFESSGTVSFLTEAGTTMTISVTQGQLVPVAVRRVNLTGSTPGLIVKSMHY